MSDRGLVFEGTADLHEDSTGGLVDLGLRVENFAFNSERRAVQQAVDAAEPLGPKSLLQGLAGFLEKLARGALYRLFTKLGILARKAPGSATPFAAPRAQPTDAVADSSDTDAQHHHCRFTGLILRHSSCNSSCSFCKSWLK